MRRMFSENQIKKITEEGLLSPDTLEQQEYNFETSFTPPAGVELNEVAFLKAVIINKVLYIVGEAKITNTTEATITNPQFSFELPEKYSKRIFRRDGTACNEDYDSNNTICRDYLISGYSASSIALLSSYANKFTATPLFSLSAGVSVEISFRIPIIL